MYLREMNQGLTGGPCSSAFASAPADDTGETPCWGAGDLTEPPACLFLPTLSTMSSAHDASSVIWVAGCPSDALSGLCQSVSLPFPGASMQYAATVGPSTAGMENAAAGGAVQESSGHSSGHGFDTREDASPPVEEVVDPLSPKASWCPGGAPLETHHNTFADNMPFDMLAGAIFYQALQTLTLPCPGLSECSMPISGLDD
jgi:hypothetical protein